MRVDLPSVRPTSVAGSSPPLLAQLRVGTTLQAIAVVDAAGRLSLDIGGNNYTARLASSESGVPRNGERLQLKVLRDSPVLVLEAKSQSSGDEASPAVEALRRLVPRQNSAAPLAANLSLLATAGADDLPTSVTQAAAKLWLALPDMDKLSSPQQLRQALTDSGAFLESKLAGAATPAGNASLANDLKALLLQFSSVVKNEGGRANSALPATAAPAPIPTVSGALQPLPSGTANLDALDGRQQQLHELARQTDGALARLTTLQVANSAADPTLQAFMVELPIRNDDQVNMLRLKIEREAVRKDQGRSGESSWTVEAALDLGAAGPLHARISLQQQRIDVQLRAASPAVVNALTERREQLEAILREAGLEVQRVVCMHGLPPAISDTSTLRLLDVRA